MKTVAYKVFTHDLRSPIRGGDRAWDGMLPYRLPKVHVDSSDNECGAGWNACATAEDALRIAGFWPDGRPSRLFRVETSANVLRRGDKLRASTWTIVEERECDVRPAIEELSRRWFVDMAEEMAAEQLAWRDALARPMHDEAIVEQSLALAIDARGLPWTLLRFDSAMDVKTTADGWVARDSWDAHDYRDAWNAYEDARYAWDSWGGTDPRRASGIMDAWGAGEFQSWHAWAGLCVRYAARCGLTMRTPDLLTVGIRDAYHAGLGMTMLTGAEEIGWAMGSVYG